MKHSFHISILLFCFYSYVSFAEDSLEVFKVEETSFMRRTSSVQSDQLTKSVGALPNITYSGTGNRSRFILLRGIGESSQFEHSQMHSIAIFYKGIDLSEESSALSLTRNDELSVNYGPQVIKWGARSLGGSIEVSPCGTLCGRNSIFIKNAEYNTHQFQIQTAHNISSESNLVTNFNIEHSDGYIWNEYLNRPTAQRDHLNLSAEINYKLNQARINQNHFFARHKNGYDNWAFEPSYKTLSDHPGQDDHIVHGHSINFRIKNWDSLTSATLTDQVDAYDEDWGNDTYWNSIPGWNQNYNYRSKTTRQRKKFHQKVQMGLDSITVGVHYFYFNERQTIDSFKDETLRRTSSPNFNSQSLGLWLTREFRFDTLNIVPSIRLDHQWVSIDETRGKQSRQLKLPLGAELKFTKEMKSDSSLELLLSHGSKGAGYNTTDQLQQDQLYYGPEEIYQAQLSFHKARHDWAGTWRGFYQMRQNQQIRSSTQSNPNDPNTFFYFTDNTGESQGYGVEGILTYSLSSVTLDSSLGLAQFKSSDTKVTYTPSWSYGWGVEYRKDQWKFRGEGYGKDGYYLNRESRFKNKPIHIFNLRTAFIFGNCSLEGFIENIFDQQTAVHAFYFANEPPNWEARNYSQLSDPRIVGVNFTVDFE